LAQGGGAAVAHRKSADKNKRKPKDPGFAPKPRQLFSNVPKTRELSGRVLRKINGNQEIPRSCLGRKVSRHLPMYIFILVSGTKRNPKSKL
jgi:hypothetical protein